MISLKNPKTNRPKKNWDDKWDGPYSVLKTYNGAVVVELPKHIHVNNSFHTSLVRPWTAPVIDGQTQLSSKEYRNVAGRVAYKWVFEKILDVHDEDKREKGLTYLI